MDSDKIFEMVKGIEEHASVNAAFGEPRTAGDKTVIPISSVWYGYGFGYGEAERKTGGETSQKHEGGGAGGGGGAKVTPIGYLEVAPNSVKFVGTPNTNRIAILGMVTAMWNVFWIARTIRSGMNRKQQTAHKGISLPQVQIPDINTKMVTQMVKKGLWKR